MTLIAHSLLTVKFPISMNPFNPSKTRKGHAVLYPYNPSVCEPVGRVSDEGGFRRAWPIGHAQPASPCGENRPNSGMTHKGRTATKSLRVKADMRSAPV